MSKKPNVSEWLKTANRQKTLRCYTCGEPESSEAIAAFYKAKKNGETLAWQKFYDDYLVPVLGYRHTYEALMNHYRNHVRGKVDG